MELKAFTITDMSRVLILFNTIFRIHIYFGNAFFMYLIKKHTNKNITVTVPKKCRCNI